MIETQHFSNDEKNLVQLGIMPPKNRYLFIFKRAIYLLSHPHKWTSWIKTLFLDLKYSHAYLGGRVNNGSLIYGRTGSSSSTYNDLKRIFSTVRIEKNDVLIDIGCGKGRVLNFLLAQKLNCPIIGVEIDPVVGRVTKKRFQRYPKIKILIGDIEDKKIFPESGTIFYLCNPFSDKILRNFSNQILEKINRGFYKNTNRPLILYNYCFFLHVFEENPFWEVTKLENVFAAIISPRDTN